MGSPWGPAVAEMRRPEKSQELVGLSEMHSPEEPHRQPGLAFFGFFLTLLC